MFVRFFFVWFRVSSWMKSFSRLRRAEVSSRSGAEAVAVNPVLLDLVAEDALGRVEQLGGFSAVAARGLECVLDDVALVGCDRLRERQARDRAGAFGGLQGRRQVMAVYDVRVADDHRALNDVLKLADVAGPMIAREHVNGRSR